MNSLPSIILKELNLIKSQRMTLALIIVYPLLVIGALGLAFSTSQEMQRVNVALFIPDGAQLGTFTAEEMVKIIEDTNKVNVLLADSPEQAAEFVKSGRSDFGLVMRTEKTADGQAVTDLLLDNSNFIVSGMFSPIAKAAIQLTSFEVSSKIIQELWNKLLPARDDLQQELGKIDLYLSDLEEAGQKIDWLQQTISQIDVSGLRGALGEQSQNIQSAKSVLLQFNSDYSSFKADIAGTKSSLDNTDTKLSSYHGKVSQQVSLAQQYRDALVSYEQQLAAIADDPGMPGEAKIQLQQLKGQVTQTRLQVDSSLAELRQIQTDIEESQQMLASMRQKLNLAESRLDSEKSTLSGFNSNLDQTTADISAMNVQVSSITQTVDDVNSLIAEAMLTKQDVSAKLQNSKEMLQSFSATLGDLGRVSPAFLSRPIQAFEKNLYAEITPLAFIIPISLGLVLLLTCLLLSSVSIITEKTEGAHLRMKMSSTHPLTLVVGKIIGQLLFAFLVSFIILAIGIVAFGVHLGGNPAEIIAAIAIASFSFISLGIFITNFAKNQSTAILGCLILILPMIFLSGAILPLQLMNPGLQAISGFLPLTAANQLLLGVLIKGLPLSAFANQLAILIAPAIALAAYSIKIF